MKRIDRFEYDINENNEITIWYDDANGEGKPFIHQPLTPEGNPWSSVEAAETWVLDFTSKFSSSDVIEEPTEVI